MEMSGADFPMIVLFFVVLAAATTAEANSKFKYREAFPKEHDGYLPESFKQRLREVASNDYLTGEARIDLVDKVYDKLPKSILLKLPLDPPVYQLPIPTQKKFRALLVDRSLGWRRRAQLYDQLVDSLPNNYRKMLQQYAKTDDGGKSSSSSSSSGSKESGGGGGNSAADEHYQVSRHPAANDFQGGGGGGDDAGGNDGGGGGGGGMDGGGGGGMDGGGGMGGGMGGGGGMDGGGGGGGGGGGQGGQGGQDYVYGDDKDTSGINYDKYVSSSSSEEQSKPWSKKSGINRKSKKG